MGLKRLAEGIIMQSIEDLWDTCERKKSEQFFDGEGVNICAELAGMSLYDEVKLFNLVQDVLKKDLFVKTSLTEKSLH